MAQLQVHAGACAPALQVHAPAWGPHTTHAWLPTVCACAACVCLAPLIALHLRPYPSLPLHAAGAPDRTWLLHGRKACPRQVSLPCAALPQRPLLPGEPHASITLTHTTYNAAFFLVCIQANAFAVTMGASTPPDDAKHAASSPGRCRSQLAIHTRWLSLHGPSWLDPECCHCISCAGAGSRTALPSPVLETPDQPASSECLVILRC